MTNNSIILNKPFPFLLIVFSEAQFALSI